MAAASFTGVSTSSPLDKTKIATGSSGNPSISQTPTLIGELITDTLSRNSTTNATTSFTSLYKDRTGSTLGAASYRIGTTTSSQADSYTGSASQNWSISGAIFRPATTTTVSGATATTTNVHHVLTDHLTGSNVILNASGTIDQLLDYYPYGGIRLDEKESSFNEKKKFTGQPYDAETSLSYFGARYQNGSIGKFISIDPVYNAMGNEAMIKAKTGMAGTPYTRHISSVR